MRYRHDLAQYQNQIRLNTKLSANARSIALALTWFSIRCKTFSVVYYPDRKKYDYLPYFVGGILRSYYPLSKWKSKDPDNIREIDNALDDLQELGFIKIGYNSITFCLNRLNDDEEVPMWMKDDSYTGREYYDEVT